MDKKIWLNANKVVSEKRLKEVNTLNRKRDFPFLITDTSFDPEKISKREAKIRKSVHGH